MCTCIPWPTWKLEDNFQEEVVFFHMCGSRGWNLGSRLGANAFTIELSFAALHVFSLLSYEALRHFSVLKKNLAVLGFKLYLFI